MSDSDSQSAFQTVIRTFVMTDVVESARLISALGDARTAEVFARHDRVVRELLKQNGGKEVNRTDGFLSSFDRPIDAVRFVLALHRELEVLSTETGVEIRERAGVNMGEAVIVPLEEGTKPAEFEGLSLVIAARIMSLAGGGQTLLTQTAFDLARRAAVGNDSVPNTIQWLAHGEYHLKGVDEPLRIFEVGAEGHAPLSPPLDSEKARRHVAPGEEAVLGWRPAPGLEIEDRMHWVLQEKLGEGGFGEVWLARHCKTGERRVFKFCFQAERLRSLKREVTLFRLLKDALGERNDIARILDWDFETPPFFIESAYTEGGNLIDWADSQGGIESIPLQTRLDLVAQTAEALAGAHSVGVLHKDIKPSNILIRQDNDGPWIELADFGIGLVTGEEVLVNQDITVTGFTEVLTGDQTSSRSGTRIYMAPELAAHKPPTIRSDIYSLGVVLYQVICGDLHRPLAQGWERHIKDDLLRDDIAGCIEGDDALRFDSAEELAKRLRSLPERRAERERQRQDREAAESARRRRHQLAWTASALGSLLFIVSAFAIQTWSGKAALDKVNRVLESEKEKAEREAYRAGIMLALMHLEGKNFGPAREALWKTPEAHRNWEWGYLLDRCYPSLLVFEGHEGPTNQVAFSQDGRLLASGSNNGIVQVWDLTIGERQAVWNGHKAKVSDLQFTTSGEFLLSGSDDGTVCVWSMDSKTPFPTLTRSLEHTNRRGAAIAGLMLPSGGEELFVAYKDGSIVTWSISTGSEKSSRKVGEFNIVTTSMSPDGKLVALACSDRAVRVMDTAKFSELHVLSNDNEQIVDVCFSPDSTLVATAWADHTIKLWRIPEFVQKKIEISHTSIILSIDFAPHVDEIVGTSEEGEIVIFDLLTGMEVRSFDGHEDAIRDVEYNSIGNLVASTSDDGMVMVWHTGGSIPTARSAKERDSRFAQSKDYSPDGSLYVTAGIDDRARVWDSGTGSLQKELVGHEDYVRDACFSIDGRRIVTVSNDNTAVVWDLIIDKTPLRLKGHENAVVNASFSPDGKLIATASLDYTARLWDLESGREMHVLETHRDSVVHVVFSHDGSMLTTCSEDGRIGMWETNSGLLLASLQGHKEGVSFACFSPDDLRIVSASKDGSIRIWDVATGYQLNVITISNASIDEVRFLNRIRLEATGIESLRNLPEVQTTWNWDAAPWRADWLPGDSVLPWKGKYLEHKNRQAANELNGVAPKVGTQSVAGD